MQDRLRQLPAVNKLLEYQSIRAFLEILPREIVVQNIQEALDMWRQRILRGENVPTEDLITESIKDKCAISMRMFLGRVVNATGVLVHTNLGRAPLAKAVLERALDICCGYCNLEFDLESGKRGDRYRAVGVLLTSLTGAEDSIVVNNNAAAVLLSLSALAKGKEVIVSRGELVEIGGGFRVPEVVQESGCILREVGTTNKTRVADYAKVINERTAAVLKVHPSNYKITGFTECPSRAELANLCRNQGILFIEDLGSGAFVPFPTDHGFLEPLVKDVISHCDLVTYSGDKLFGGPQAGFISGRKNLLESIRRQPLLRALRVDKITLAVIQELLFAYSHNHYNELQLWKMASTTIKRLKERLRYWQSNMAELWDGKILPDSSTIGGGSLPGETISTQVLALQHDKLGPIEIAAHFRSQSPPVIGRVQNDRFLLDPRTVEEEYDDYIKHLLS